MNDAHARAVQQNGENKTLRNRNPYFIYHQETPKTRDYSNSTFPEFPTSKKFKSQVGCGLKYGILITN